MTTDSEKYSPEAVAKALSLTNEVFNTLAAVLRAAEEREAMILQAIEQLEADMASTHQFFQMGVSAALEAARSVAARALESSNAS